MNTLRLTVLITFLALICTPGAFAAKIYKSVDKEGNVTFTDVPPADAKDGLEFNEINSYPAATKADNPAPRSTRRRPLNQTAEEEPEKTALPYTSITVTAPKNEANLRDNAGNVTISIAVSPLLQSKYGHRTEILVNGTVASKGSQANLELTNLDRGTHVVTARIVDQNGNTLLASEPSKFHLQRYSTQHRKPATAPRRAAN